MAIGDKDFDDYLVKFDFYGGGEYTKVSFSSIDIDSVPMKEFFDKSRVGFEDINSAISSPTVEITLIKKIYFTEKIIDGTIVRDIDMEKLVNNFFIHYFVFMDMPLEFRIKNGSEYMNVHGFLQNIKFPSLSIDFSVYF